MDHVATHRLFVSDQVAVAKFGTDQPADDPVPERDELNRVRWSAMTRGIDPDAAVLSGARPIFLRGWWDRTVEVRVGAKNSVVQRSQFLSGLNTMP